jgi:hypothetical protein
MNDESQLGVVGNEFEPGGSTVVLLRSQAYPQEKIMLSQLCGQALQPPSTVA